MKLKFIALYLLMLVGVNMVKGQENSKNVMVTDNKSELRLSVSDGTTQSLVSSMGGGLVDAVLGSKRTDQKYSIVYGLGCRYNIGRFKVGADLGFSHASSNLTLDGDSKVSVKERELSFLVLPSAEFVYFKRRLVELYGGASAGVGLLRHTESGQTEIGKKAAKKSDLTTSFAYQVNPIAVRVGNDRVGGFVEAGFGYKGFLTAGLSFKF